MPSFIDVVNGASADASTIQQVVDALKGTAGKGIPLSPTAVNDAINFALAVKNNDAGASKGLVVYKADGTVLLQADKNGVIGSPDGVAGAAPILTTTGTQTLTNKTLTSPVLSQTAPATDGALGEAAGGLLSIGNGTVAIPVGAYKIAETILGVSAASFDFQNIPATFHHLLLDVHGRGDIASVTNSALLRLNNDSTTNYNRHYLSFTGGGAASQTEGLAATSIYIGEFAAASAQAGKAGYAAIFIAHYSGTTWHKEVKFQAGIPSPNGAGTSWFAVGAGQWASTAAVNRVTVLAPGGSNWVAGSIATLYGLP